MDIFVKLHKDGQKCDDAQAEYIRGDLTLQIMAAFKLLAKRVDGQYVAGENVSIADYLLISEIYEPENIQLEALAGLVPAYMWRKKMTELIEANKEMYGLDSIYKKETVPMMIK